MNKSKNMSAEEREFLENYDITIYDRPSVTADIAIFTIRNDESENYRRDAQKHLSVLLIKRGEYPYKNCWAFPGGFLKIDETIEQCVMRETIEETGITPSSIVPIGVFSDIDRDPRGRIISNAFASIITENLENIIGGDDAVQASWFDVSFDKTDNGIYNLTLKNSQTTICTQLREISSKFEQFRYVIEGGESLAFDHSAILASALSALKKYAENFEVVFDFLPEKFTLTQMMCVQETLLNASQLSANFRRKVAAYVEETDEYVTGVGHRPAKLYKKRITN